MNIEKIEKLADDVFEAEEHYKILGMRSTSHIDYSEQKKARIEHALAETKMIEARQALRAEQGL